MRLARSWREWCFVPFLIFGYMETLRRATFHSFGLTIQGSAFTIASILIVIWVALDYYCRKIWVRILYGIAVMGYLLMVLVSNYMGNGLDRAGSFLSLPVLAGYSGSGKIDFLLICIFIFYGVLLYLVGYYVLERKNIAELTAASTLLIGVEIASSKLDISFLIISHIIFVLLLRSNAFYLHLLSYPDFRKEKRQFGSGWISVNLAITLIIVIIALLIPTRGSGLTVTSRPVQWARDKVVEKVKIFPKSQSFSTGQLQEDDFHIYWDKLQCFEIQGSVEASDNLVMSVKSPRAFYWRGESADYYTGSGWKNTFALNQVNKSDNELPSPYGERVPLERVEQVYTLAPDLTSTVIFTANVPEKVELPGKAFWSDEAGNLYTEEMKSGFTYKVVSYIPEFNEKQLRITKMGYGRWIEKHYLQLPENLPSRIKDKAVELTKGLAYPYDKAKAIEKYLSKNYPYTLEVHPPRKGRDIVDYFLFDLKKGYCTYHSTAMIVMLRSIGIPARWVKGFASGTYDAETETYMVKEGDAHAWVEVYFGDYGWVPFEPTAAFQMPPIRSEAASVIGEAEPLPSAQNMVLDYESVESDSGGNNFDKFVKYPVFALTFVVTFYFWLSIRRSLKDQKVSRVRDYYIDMVYLLESKGYSRPSDQTPCEFAVTIGENLPGVREDIALLTEGYLKEQYGKHNFNEGHFENFRRAWENIINTLNI